MINMNDLANHIIEVTNKNRISITNLQLQKVMYFAFQYATNEPELFNINELKDIYSTPFQVWRYGPVQRHIYEKYRIFNANPIFSPTARIVSFFNKDSFNKYIMYLMRRDPFQLVDESHMEPFWRDHKNAIRGYRSNIDYKFSDVKSGWKIWNH